MRSLFEKFFLLTVPLIFVSCVLALVGSVERYSLPNGTAELASPLPSARAAIAVVLPPVIRESSTDDSHFPIASSSEGDASAPPLNKEIAKEGVSPQKEMRKVERELVLKAPELKNEGHVPRPHVLQSSLSEEEISQLLSIHNRVRAKKEVPPLVWSDTLSASAAEWADTLANRGCALEHSHGSFGENIYYSRKTGPNQTLRSPEEVMQGFLDEIPYYNYERNTCKAGEICGHYTQIVWADSLRVGCAKSLCQANEREEIWVCQYDPQGNIEGMKPY